MTVLRSQRTEPLSLTADALNTGIVSAYSWASEDGSTTDSNGKDYSGNARHWTVSGNGTPPIVTTSVGKGRDTSNGRTAHNLYWSAASSNTLGMAVGTGDFTFSMRIRMPSVAPATTAVRDIFRFSDGSGQPLIISVYEVNGTGWCWYPYFSDGTTKLAWNDSGNPNNTLNSVSTLTITRASGTVKFYVEGTLIKTVASNATNFLATANQPAIAGLYDNNGGTDPDFVLIDNTNWNRALSATEVAAQATNPYVYQTNSAVADSIAVTTPAASATVGTNINISGTYAGSDNPTTIEASFNGGAYADIAVSPTGGTFSGTLTGQSAGTGTLSVRWKNIPSVIATVASVTVTATSITFTTPNTPANAAVPYRMFQRNGSNQASVRITGTYTGTPTAIEWQWAGGSWATLVASPTGGAFDATVTLPSLGQGSLNIRFSNATGVTASLPAVGCGDVFLLAGQSNNVGKATNYITPVVPGAHPSWAAVECAKNGIWRLNQETSTYKFDDPTGAVYSVNSDPTPGGSYCGALATSLMAAGVPCAFVPCALGSTGIPAWAVSTSTTTLYGALLATANTIGGHKAVIWWQGENEANDNTQTQAQYTTALNAIVNDWISRFPSSKWILCNINNMSNGGSPWPYFTQIHNAIAAVASGNSNVIGIADMNGAWSTPNTHFGQGAASEITTVASRIFSVLNAGFYSRKVTLPLVDVTGAALASLSGIKWALFDNVTPDALVAPTARGTGAVTDASGNLLLLIPNTGVAVGGTGWLVISNSDGTVSQSPVAKAFSGPVVVS